MREEILSNIENPELLEKLYRENKTDFKKEFDLIYPEIQENLTAQIWYERLKFDSEEISWGTNNELIYVIVISFFAGLTAKIPEFTGIESEYFYPRNLSFIVFPFLTAYFILKQELSVKKIFTVSIIILLSALYINLLPDNPDSHTLILACIHLPVILWAMLGFAYVGEELNNYKRRLDFVKYNGDLVVMTTIILIAGVILSLITRGLFSLIEINIDEIYIHYIAVWGLAAAPIVGTYLIQTNPQLVNKVSPVIAKVFTPLVFLTLLIYLIAVVFTGKDPYSDREFLLLFNVLLIGVMAIIIFSISGAPKNSESKAGRILLLGLSILTVIVNGIALSAIVFRISEWGITPNKLAVLGGNILILVNLLIVIYGLFRSINESSETVRVEKSISNYIPVYILWAVIVTFLFPVIFGFS